MNTELKALFSLVLDGYQIVQSAIAKQNFFFFLPQIYQVAMDIAPAVANWNDLQPEILALSGSEQEADLAAFIEQKFGVIGAGPEAQAVVSASLKLIQDGVALEAAIQALIHVKK